MCVTVVYDTMIRLLRLGLLHEKSLIENIEGIKFMAIYNIYEREEWHSTSSRINYTYSGTGGWGKRWLVVWCGVLRE